VRAPQRRSPLHQVEPVRHEDADERSRAGGRQALDRRAVYTETLALARLETDFEAMAAVFVVHVNGDAHDLLAEAHELALVCRPAGAAGAAEVDSLEQVALPGAVRPTHKRQSSTQRDLRPLVVAEVPEAEARDSHLDLDYTFSLIGMTR